MIWFARFIFALFVLGVSSVSNAEEGFLKKVGGEFTVSQIKRINSDKFMVVFTSTVKNMEPTTLVLTSDHVHVGLETGLKLRLSAEVAELKHGTAHLKQVLLFMPPSENASNTLPVWMLSSVYPVKALKGARYIEMHAPSSDYQVM